MSRCEQCWAVLPSAQHRGSKCKVCRRIELAMQKRAARKAAAQGRPVGRRGPVPRAPDDPADVIEAKLAAAERHVRATRPYTVDAWARREGAA